MLVVFHIEMKWRKWTISSLRPMLRTCSTPAVSMSRAPSDLLRHDARPRCWASRQTLGRKRPFRNDLPHRLSNGGTDRDGDAGRNLSGPQTVSNEVKIQE